LIIKPLKLSTTIKNYPWGKLGQASAVWSLLEDNSESKKGEERPFAELWIGTHPNGESKILNEDSNSLLSEVIASDFKQLLGEGVANNFNKKLPFLFKILSIGRALSIQAHPDKQLAKKLHQQNPEWYPDTNHKPELGIALSETSLLYGFLSHEGIIQNLETVPELETLFGIAFLVEALNCKDALSQKQFLKKITQELFAVSKSKISEGSKALFQRLEKQSDLTAIEKLILKLKKEYPEGDIGLWFFFLLNHVCLKPGEAIFIEPNIPHSYLEGDLAECMASSDNVVRAGLTNKPIDTEVLREMLTYQQKFPEIIKPQQLSEILEIKTYFTDCREFVVDLIEDQLTLDISSQESLEVYFCFQGKGSFVCAGQEYKFKAGDSYLIPASLGTYQLHFDGGKLFRVRIPS
jgi:mannose-6-phosphate isomerase